MELQNPPIVEAWIEFRFDTSDRENTWQQERVGEFLGQISSTYVKQEGIWQEAFEITHQPNTPIPQKITGEVRLERVRAYSEDRSRCVQAGESLLVVSITKSGADYPGFNTLLKEALEHLGRFSSVFRPQAVREVALHYVDLLSLPRTGDEPINLDDYLKLIVHVPNDKDWPLQSMLARVGVPIDRRTGESDELVVQLRDERPGASSPDARFRIDWHLVSRAVDTLNAHEIAKRLENLHTVAREFFRQAFTDLAWDMFDPSDS